jgi:tight adherence protein B
MSLSQWIALALGIALFFLLLALFWLARGARRRREELLIARLGIAPGPGQGPAIRIRSAAEERHSALTAYLERCGYTVPAGRLLGACAAGSALAGLVAALATGSPLAGPVVAAVALLVVRIVIARRHGRRVRQVTEGLPVALELMILGLRAGQSLEQAIRSAAVEVEPPLSAELERCCQEHAMGRSVESALEQLRARWRPVRALATFVEAVVVLKRTGGNMIEVLETLVEGLRARATLEARHRALTSEGRTSGVILMLLPVAALVIQTTMAPEQLHAMAADGTGRLYLALAGALWLSGALWVSRLVRPEGR